MSETDPAAAIEAVGLSRRFGRVLALDALTLELRPGSSLGLLGTNGAGKTTFIRLVTGTLLPSAGRLVVEGTSPAEHPSTVQRRIGFVMETSRLYPELRVSAFLRFAGGARGLAGAALTGALERAVADFDLGDVVHRLVGCLSKGYQQRVSLAQALLHDPPIVIVDEPTGGLDPLQREEVHGVLQRHRGERTLLLCTHDLDEARALTDRVAVLHAGRLVTQGPTGEVLDGERALALFERGRRPS